MSQNAFEEIKISWACNPYLNVMALSLKMGLKKKKLNTLKPRDITEPEPESRTCNCQMY